MLPVSSGGIPGIVIVRAHDSETVGLKIVIAHTGIIGAVRGSPDNRTVVGQKRRYDLHGVVFGFQFMVTVNIVRFEQLTLLGIVVVVSVKQLRRAQGIITEIAR